MSPALPSVYLNTAATGLLEPEVAAVGQVLYATLATGGSTRAESWRAEEEPAIRASIAGFLNAPVECIAMLPNFSWGMNGLVQSLKGTERILLYRGDYPSLTLPFTINKFPVTWIEAPDGFSLPLEEIRTAIRSRAIDIIAISHAQYNSGYLLPVMEIGELCREHGVRLIIDATQSIGAVPIDMSIQFADALIASNYKWMNAGFGTGIMYISPDFLKAYPPVVGGFASYVLREGIGRYEPTARSYEPGHSNLTGFSILRAAIEHRQAMGVGAVSIHNMRLTRMLLEGLAAAKLPLVGPYEEEYRAPFVLLRDEGGLSDRIRERNIVVTIRGGMVRISMHYYNSEADVAVLLESMGS